MFEQINLKLSDFFARQAGVNRNGTNSTQFDYLIDKPAWLSLDTPALYRQAVNDNPILNGCISILAKACSNGKKYLVDLKGNEIPWNSRNSGVQECRRLFLDEPNPMQSPFEFNYERYFMLFTFGNN